MLMQTLSLSVLKFYVLLQVLCSDNPRYGFNAATGNYEDLMAAGIIDPTKVCCRILGLC